ncbi:MAG TPA: hypothetical protein VNN22_11080 [Verrucomicrobiae bacterium]|nr:hypothetical protein [Verrucomicrobiae bacterium]
MSATEIIEQFKGLPASERAQVAKYVVEHDDSWVPESFKQGMADAEAGRFMDMKTAVAKWRGRGHLPAGKNADEYLRLTRDANGN